jgi:hypothetical protein
VGDLLGLADVPFGDRVMTRTAVAAATACHECPRPLAPGGRLPRYSRNHRSRTEPGRRAQSRESPRAGRCNANSLVRLSWGRQARPFLGPRDPSTGNCSRPGAESQSRRWLSAFLAMSEVAVSMIV